MPINGLLRLIVDLNSRLPVAMQIMDTLTKSEDLLRRDIEAVLGYKRFSSMNPEASVISSRDSGLGLLGILSASQTPDARAVPPSLSSRTLQHRGSNNSLDDRQKLTVSMRGKPRLADLMEEEQETGGSTQSAARRNPIRRSDRRHSLTEGGRDHHIREAATLPRAHNMRNLQNWEGHRVRFQSFRVCCGIITGHRDLHHPPRSLPGLSVPETGDLIDQIQISTRQPLEASSERSPGFITPYRQAEESSRTIQTSPVNQGSAVTFGTCPPLDPGPRDTSDRTTSGNLPSSCPKWTN